MPNHKTKHIIVLLMIFLAFLTHSFQPANAASSSIWPASVTPGFSWDNSSPIELGLKFRSDVSGNVTGVRFFKATGATGTHIGRLWTVSGVKLAEVTFIRETASGWQTAIFPSAVAIQANTTYIISYYVADGNRRFSDTSNYFATVGVDTPPLHALKAGVDGVNSVYSDTGGFFNQSFNFSNYWVDVVFDNAADTSPPTVSTVVPANGTTNVAISTNFNVTFSEAMDATTLNPNTITLQDNSNHIIPTTLSYSSATFTATLVPASALNPSTTYTIILPAGGAKDLAGNALLTNFTSTFTTGEPDTIPPTVISVVPVNGSTDVSSSTNINVTFSEAMDTSSITTGTITLKDSFNQIVPATVNYNSITLTATLAPISGLNPSATYTLLLSAGGVKDLTGNTLVANYTSTFTTAGSVPVAYSIFSAVTPGFSWDNSSPIELGLKFRSDVSGNVTGVRFFKASGATGTHIGRLWTTSGVKLAEVTFVSETASGWQTATFPKAVVIQANTTYIISYYVADGNRRFSDTSNFFTAAGVDTPPLHALKAGVEGQNGVYSDTGGFFNQSYNSSNYWVDVVFDNTVDKIPPTVSAVVPANGSQNVAISTNLNITFSEAMDANTLNTNTIILLAQNAETITSIKIASATVNYNPVTFTATLVPTSALNTFTTYSVLLPAGGSKDLAGNTLATDFTSTFTTGGPDTIHPTVSTVVPANGSTDVAISADINVTFSEAMDIGSITTGTIILKDASDQLVPVAVSYKSDTQTATLTPTANLNPVTAYTVLVPAGGVKDVAENALIVNYTSTFTTAVPTYSIFSTATPGFSYDNPSAIELGLKFRSDISGNITGVRFLKASGATGTHIGRLWTTGGVKLAEVTFTNETASGWQTATFPSAVAIQANTTYIISYYIADGNRRFSDTFDYFVTADVNMPPLHALQAGVDGPNGVYSDTGGFFNQNHRSSNYWVDAIFTSIANVSDIITPTVVSVSPIDASSNLRLATSITVYFSEQVDPATISSATIQLRDNIGNLVPATVTSIGNYNATLVPNLKLSNSIVYTLQVKSGASGIKDLAGNALASNYTSSFSTISLRPPVDQTPGGPILIISKSSNLYTRYYSEILRTEGFNEFDLIDISQITSQILAKYDVVILGEMPLTPLQVLTFTDWVNNGGNLIAMRPDKQLQDLLGLADTSSTLSEGYLSINVSTIPGAGITGQTLQFHSIADQYSLNGATALASLYSNATTTTQFPAVTLQSVGINGGQAAAFTFDLARSIIYTHQGNPAWQIDHVNPLQAYGTALDLFYDSSTPWVDFNRISIPQADEQQRFFANLILYMNSDKKPLPRFWYFPKGKKAVIVLTGDDHNTRSLRSGDTIQFFSRHESQSPIGCSIADWECVRSSSYLSPEDLSLFTLTDVEAANYTAKGFEVGLHPDAGLASGGVWCGTWPSDMAIQYSNQLDSFMSYYASIPVQGSERSHCYSWFGYTGGSTWNGYGGKPEIEANLGIRFDTNITYNPSDWAIVNPGYQMGSAMMMRFAQIDIGGTMTAYLDIYNAGTQITDDNGQGASAIRTIVDSYLDAANGALGFYGGFVVNMHSDNYYGWSYDGSDQVVASAQTHGVPIVSGRQMSDWLDARNSSSFGSIIWDGTSLGFTIAVDPHARNLQAMLPTKLGHGVLNRITQNGIPISYTIQTIKGIEYAFFSATTGPYTATY